MSTKDSKNSSAHGDLEEAVLQAGALVMFDHNGEVLLGVVTGLIRKRYHIFSERSREIELDSTRIYPLPGVLPNGVNTANAKVEYLQEINRSAHEISNEINLEETWQVLLEQASEVSVKELCELYFGKDTLLEHVAMRYTLIEDKLYFKRHAAAFIPRTQEAVQQLKHSAEERERMLLQQSSFVEVAKLRSSGSRDAFAPEHLNFLRLLEDIAAISPHSTPALQKQGKELLEKIEQALQLQRNGKIEERAFEALVKIEHFDRNTNLVPLRYRPRKDFPKAVLDESKSISVSTICDSERRRDATGLSAFTIDDSSTLDMDDALTFEHINDGFRVGIHISDVATIIKIGTSLDQEALKRATSIYLPEETIPMLPESISEDRASLRANEVREAISCFINFSRDGQIKSTEITPTLVRVLRRYTYNEVDAILEHQSSDELSVDLQGLYEIAVGHETHRLGSGGSRIDKRDVLIRIGQDGNVVLEELDEHSPARLLVAEMAVLANATFASYAADHKIPFVFRGQDKPVADEEDDTSSQIPEGPALDYAKRSKLKRSIITTHPVPHASLGLSAYAQVTSPIRRYLDLINQRQLIAALRGQPLPYSKLELSNIIDSAEERLGTAMTITKETKRFWILKYLEGIARERKELTGTVTRNNMRYPMVELDDVWQPFPLKTERRTKLGERVRLKIAHVNATWEQIRLEEASGAQI